LKKGIASKIKLSYHFDSLLNSVRLFPFSWGTVVYGIPLHATQRNATQRNATQRNATQRNATQRNATQRTWVFPTLLKSQVFLPYFRIFFIFIKINYWFILLLLCGTSMKYVRR